MRECTPFGMEPREYVYYKLSYMPEKKGDKILYIGESSKTRTSMLNRALFQICKTIFLGASFV